MSWLQRFHDEHTALFAILPKLEGNLKDIEHGEAGENVIWELREFARIIKDVIIPHFRDEEKNAYPKASQASEEGEKFIAEMYEEHTLLYETFEGFITSLGQEAGMGTYPLEGESPARLISLSKNFDENEVPKNLDRVTTPPSLEVDKEGVLKYGYAVVRLLVQHIKKEENELTRLLKKIQAG